MPDFGDWILQIPLDLLGPASEMREIAIPVMLTAASLAMPVKHVLEEDMPFPVSHVEVLSNPIVMPSVGEGEEFEFAFVAFHAPTIDIIKVGLANAALEALPTSLTSKPQTIQRFDTSSGNLVTAVEVENSPAAHVLMAQSPDIWEVSASVLNIRAGPSSRDSIVGTLARGARVLVIGDSRSGWMPVRSDSLSTKGWVYSRHLAPLS